MIKNNNKKVPQAPFFNRKDNIYVKTICRFACSDEKGGSRL